jgi:hypothetical protein
MDEVNPVGFRSKNAYDGKAEARGARDAALANAAKSRIRDLVLMSSSFTEASGIRCDSQAPRPQARTR